MECRPFAGPRGDGDAAAVRLDDRPDSREPEPAPESEPAPEPEPEPEPEPAPELEPEPKRVAKPEAAYQGTTLEDLESGSMPTTQKVVIVAAIILIIVAIAYFVFLK